MPALRGHGVCDIVDIQGIAFKSYNGDEGFAHDLEVCRKDGVGADGGFDGFGGADYGVAGLCVAGFADGKEGGVAGCYSVGGGERECELIICGDRGGGGGSGGLTGSLVWNRRLRVRRRLRLTSRGR